MRSSKSWGKGRCNDSVLHGSIEHRIKNTLLESGFASTVYRPSYIAFTRFQLDFDWHSQQSAFSQGFLVSEYRSDWDHATAWSICATLRRNRYWVAFTAHHWKRVINWVHFKWCVPPLEWPVNWFNWWINCEYDPSIAYPTECAIISIESPWTLPNPHSNDEQCQISGEKWTERPTRALWIVSIGI